MAVPLVHDERTLGVLSVLDRPKQSKFSLAEMELLGSSALRLRLRSRCSSVAGAPAWRSRGPEKTSASLPASPLTSTRCPRSGARRGCACSASSRPCFAPELHEGGSCRPPERPTPRPTLAPALVELEVVLGALGHPRRWPYVLLLVELEILRALVRAFVGRLDVSSCAPRRRPRSGSCPDPPPELLLSSVTRGLPHHMTCQSAFFFPCILPNHVPGSRQNDDRGGHPPRSREAVVPRVTSEASCGGLDVVASSLMGSRSPWRSSCAPRSHPRSDPCRSRDP